MKFKVYRYGGFSHNNINEKIMNESAFVSVESGFHKS